MKTRYYLIILILISLNLIADEIIVDKIIAKVGREVILLSELNTRIQQMEAANVLDSLFTDYDILRDMIESRIIVQQAKEEGYEVDELEIKDLAEKQIESISSQFQNEEQFKKELDKETGLTVPELKDFYIEIIREGNLREQFIENKIRSKVHVTEAEIENYYSEYKEEIPTRPAMEQLGMILRIIKPSKKTKQQGLIEINQIMDRLKEGEEFAEIIESLTKDNEYLMGGDLGFFGKGMMVKSFEDAAFSLREGEISDVVETEFGFHIIKMEEKKEDEIRVSHILRLVEATEEDIRSDLQLMEEILMRLRNGENFEQLARQYSEDDESAMNGGIIGEFKTDDYPELFSEYFTDLELGNYSDLIREENNIYIFAKLREIPERSYTYEEIYDRLKSIVISEKEEELYENLVTDLMKEYYVETFLD